MKEYIVSDILLKTLVSQQIVSPIILGATGIYFLSIMQIVYTGSIDQFMIQTLSGNRFRRKISRSIYRKYIIKR